MAVRLRIVAAGNATIVSMLLDPIPSPVAHADFAALEWEPLLALVAAYAASPVGREAILALQPSTDEEWIGRQHRLVSEVRLLLEEQVSIPLGGLFDPTQLAAKAQIAGAALEAAELQSVRGLRTISPHGRRCCASRPRGWLANCRGYQSFRLRSPAACGLWQS